MVYLLDAEYSFGLAAQIVTHLADRERIPALISVAIAYPDKTQYRRFRTRDYTPTFSPTGGYGPEYQEVSGGGPEFLAVIQEEIIPYVESHFPAANIQRTLVGHSYGGLFASYVWMQAPQTFANYILVSPSLWYDDGAPLRDARATCKSPLPGKSKRMFLAVGEYEEQPQNQRAMVSDLRAYEAILKNCPGRTISVYSRVYIDETHASIFPAALSTGLRKLFQ